MAGKATQTSRRKTAPTSGRKVAKKRRKVVKKTPPGKVRPPAGPAAPVVAPGSPDEYRARVRMYRHGLGDCFLVTFPRKDRAPFQMLIDCGVLGAGSDVMTRMVEHVRDSVKHGNGGGKAHLDVVVATHEHRDHLSGFNQARQVFTDDFDFGAVWLGWTENLSQPQIKQIKEAKKRVATGLRMALSAPAAAAAGNALDGVAGVLGFADVDDTADTGRIAGALDYLKLRGNHAGQLRYLNPGEGPFELDGVDGVRVYVLGPPRDPIMLKGSEVTERMKKDGVVYHLTRTGQSGLDALNAALGESSSPAHERCHPFAPEHRIPREVPGRVQGRPAANPYFAGIEPFVSATYDNPTQQWRRIDHEWLSAFRQLALDMDSDTNNTSLVLAFEFVKTREVLLFVGDAQVGNWQSWSTVEFQVPGRRTPMPAHDLLARTVFYKVGHHSSHNATLRTGGLELMTHDDLVAFIPLDKGTAKNQGWDMPAAPLYARLVERTKNRVVISDAKEVLTEEARTAGIIATDSYVDYFLR